MMCRETAQIDQSEPRSFYKRFILKLQVCVRCVLGRIWSKACLRNIFTVQKLTIVFGQEFNLETMRLELLG